jgi:hypothetical protein
LVSGKVEVEFEESRMFFFQRIFNEVEKIIIQKCIVLKGYDPRENGSMVQEKFT